MFTLHLRLSSARDARGWVSTQALALTAAPLARAGDLSVAALNATVGQGAAQALLAVAVIHAAAPALNVPDVAHAAEQVPSAEQVVHICVRVDPDGALEFQFFRAAEVVPLVPSPRFARREVARCAEDDPFFQAAPDAQENYFHPLGASLGRWLAFAHAAREDPVH